MGWMPGAIARMLDGFARRAILYTSPKRLAAVEPRMPADYPARWRVGIWESK